MNSKLARDSVYSLQVDVNVEGAALHSMKLQLFHKLAFWFPFNGLDILHLWSLVLVTAFWTIGRWFGLILYSAVAVGIA